MWLLQSVDFQCRTPLVVVSNYTHSSEASKKSVGPLTWVLMNSKSIHGNFELASMLYNPFCTKKPNAKSSPWQHLHNNAFLISTSNQQGCMCMMEWSNQHLLV
jgi:hypothetical protein